jgi:hypothetical protein
MAFEKLRTIVITAIPNPRSRERFRKMAEKPANRKLTPNLPKSPLFGNFRRCF